MKVKASEFITDLQKLVDEHGDHELIVYDGITACAAGVEFQSKMLNETNIFTIELYDR